VQRAALTLQFRKVWLVWLAVLRAFTLIFALQLGGVLHDASDLLSAIAAESDTEHEQCPADGPCDDCPPGCPNCHCGVLGSLSAAPRLAIAPPDALSARSPSFEVAEAPKGPELPGLFRPPRARRARG
jgi:hypothetical protein